MSAKFKDLALDALDHQRMADWWCTTLGYVRRDTDRPRDWPVAIVDPAGRRVRMGGDG